MTINESGSEDYRAGRRSLLEAERALRNQREEVAKLRRSLPQGPVLPSSYEFVEAKPQLGRSLRMDDLFAPGRDELFVYHMMFGPDWDEGCPLCSMWLDGLNGVADHLAERVNFAVVAKAGADKLGAWAEQRGWNRLRLVSSRSSSFNADLGLEGADENEQNPGVSVFTRDGAIRLSYTGQAELGEDDPRPYQGDPRGMDMLSPVWQVLDLLPSGRLDWYPSNRLHASLPS